MSDPSGKDYDLLNPNPPKSARRLKRNLLGLLLTFILVALVAVTISQLTSPPALPEQDPSLDTWHQYGMAIQYPAGVTPKYGTSTQSTVSSSLGGAEWSWNGGSDALGLACGNGTSFNAEAGFVAIQDKLRFDGFNVTFQGQGNISGSWQYETYKLAKNGQTFYGTFALTFVANHGRAYQLEFLGPNPDTLATLSYYLQTFSG